MAKMRYLTLFLVILLILLIYYIEFMSKPSTLSVSPLVKLSDFKIGLVNQCRKVPAFISALNMRQPALDSKQQSHKGLQIRDLSSRRTWHHPSWSQSGYIGAYDRDNLGHLYITPSPYVSLLDNPPHKQNQIYQINNQSAEMTPLLQLPEAHLINSKNPFGVMGIFYDCDTHSLYVSSLAGSKPRSEKGTLFQISLTNHEIVSTFEKVDAIGIGVFNSGQGKTLYYGSARHPHLYSVKLNEQGHFIGDKHFELSLSSLKGGSSNVIKKFIFQEKLGVYYMILQDIEFGFRLMAANHPFHKRYHFKYNVKDGWNFSHLSVEK